MHKQLLDQARHLATKERQRPQQVSLRRAVSAAYYAPFHFLIDAACRTFVGTAGKDRELRAVLARAFDHGVMAAASKSFQGGTLPDHLKPVLRGSPLPPDLVKIASTFVILQEQRHRADYDLSAQFLRHGVIGLINRVDIAMTIWNGIRDDPAAHLYLISLLTWNNLAKRR